MCSRMGLKLEFVCDRAPKPGTCDGVAQNRVVSGQNESQGG
jgi:hypothetical protein